MHLDDETTQRWLHGELGPEARRAASDHLADCPACRQLLADAEQEDRWIQKRLSMVDHPIPVVSPGAIPRDPRAPRWLRWAAAVVLTCALAGAAYAIPGSPLPRWLAQLGLQRTGPDSADVAPPTAFPTTSGITVPLEPQLTIRFEGTQARGVARVQLVEGRTVSVRALNGGATFATGPGTLSVGNRGSVADYEIDLPRTARWIAITLGDRRLLLKRDTLVTGVAPPGPDGGYTLLLNDGP
jgi:anti-sigma factor RsiW